MLGIGGLFIGRYRSGILQRMPVRDAVEGLFMGRPTCYRSPILQRMHVGDLGGLIMGRYRSSILQRMHIRDGVAGLWVL